MFNPWVQVYMAKALTNQFSHIVVSAKCCVWGKKSFSIVSILVHSPDANRSRKPFVTGNVDSFG